MIYLGTSRSDKLAIVREYVASNEVEHVVVIGPKKFDFPHEWESIDWPLIIKYKVFYRLLQEIGPKSLVVVNECLRTQQRSDLTLNCIRHYLSQTQHQLVFNWLPIIDQFADFMTLVDFDTQSRFKGTGWSDAVKQSIRSVVVDRKPAFVEDLVPVGASTRKKYASERQKLFDGIGAKDPHTIPRNLHLIAGADKAKHVGECPLIGRNNRFKFGDMASYKDESITGPRTVFEAAHNFIDMVDFLTLTEQTEVPFLTTELKVDQWYFSRYREWSERIKNAYAAIHS